MSLISLKNGLSAHAHHQITHTENTHTQVRERANKWTDGRTFRFCSSLGKLIRTNTNEQFVQKPAALLKLEANCIYQCTAAPTATNTRATQRPINDTRKKDQENEKEEAAM